jgi:hypothetical protein
VCVERGLQPWKFKIPMKTRFSSKVIKFIEVLEFKEAILLCYGQHKTIILQQRILKVEI